MKKLTLFIAAFMTIAGAIAQDQKMMTNGKVKHASPKTQSHDFKPKTAMRNGTMNVAAIIFSEDFGSGIPGTWSVVDNNSTGLLWTAAFGPAGGGASAGDTLMSTTAANGFAMVDDDAFGSAAPARNTDMITPAINCSTNSNVHITFQDYFLQYLTSTATLSISNDGGVSWTDIYVATTTTPNPNLVDIDVTTYAANQADVRFKFNYDGNWDYWWQVDDINVYEPLTVDGAVVDVLTTEPSCQMTATEPVMIRIRNSGATAISNFPASFKADNGSTVTETVTASINPNDTLDFTFAGTANLSVLGIHQIKAWVAITSDGNASNDSGLVSTVNIAPVVINSTSSLNMGFELTDDLLGWTINDANSDGETWGLAYNPNFSVMAHTGDYCLRAGNAGVNADDWVVSSCIDLQTGVNYVLDFWQHLFDQTADMEAYIGNSNDIVSLTQLITTGTGVVGSWINTTGTFTVPSTGTYYVGLRNYASGTPGIQRIDDIVLTLAAGVGEVNKEQKWFDVYPNPASSNLNIKMNRPFDNASVEIINGVGSVVKSFKSASNLESVDISNLQSGIYTAKVSFDGQAVYKRFTITK